MKKLLTILLFLSFAFSQGVTSGLGELSVSGNVSESGFGFQPDGLITFSHNNNSGTDAIMAIAISDMTDAGSLGFGFAKNDGEAGSVLVSTYSSTDNVHNGYVPTNNSEGKSSLVSQDADGFTYNLTDTNTNFDFAYMAFGGGQTKVKVGFITLTASTGNLSETGIGFSPNAVIFIGVKENDSDFNSSEPTGTLAVGFMDDNGNEFCGAVRLNQGDSQAWRDVSITDTFIELGNNTRNTEFEYVSMDADGFTVNVTNTTLNLRIAYMAIGGVNAKVVNDLVETSTGTFNSPSLGFQADAVFGVWTGQTTVATKLDAIMCVGFAVGTATTDQYYMTFTEDNQGGNTITDHNSDDTYFILQENVSGTVEGFLDVESFNADDITFNQIDASPHADIFGYLAIKILDVGVVEEENALFFGINF